MPAKPVARSRSPPLHALCHGGGRLDPCVERLEPAPAIGPLLDTVGGDLLAVVRAGELVQTPEGQVSDFLGAMASALLLGREGGGTRSTSSWLLIAIADGSGRVLYVERCSDSTMLTDPDAAKGMVAQALAGLPKADRLLRP